jgi:hypothetical protein
VFVSHAADVRERARALHREGASDAAVAAELGLPRSTVRDWRLGPSPAVLSDVCPRCWRRSRPIRSDAADYAEALGLYLGDGHILRIGRSHRLRVSLDARYPIIVADAEALLTRMFPANRCGRAQRDHGATQIVSVDHGHLPCLFPQHGPGRKHERAIRLEPWQQATLGDAPWSFLRGCIRSDGCVFVNRTGRYRYLSYDFANRSRDILDLFEQTCSRVGVDCRRYDRHIRVYRRASVAALVEHVGLKA